MMRRLIFSVPTSMIALASLRNGRPERYPQLSFHIENHKIRDDESILDLYQKIMDNTLRVLYGRVSQLNAHHSGGKSRITKFLKCGLGHNVDTCPKVI